MDPRLLWNCLLLGGESRAGPRLSFTGRAIPRQSGLEAPATLPRLQRGCRGCRRWRECPQAPTLPPRVLSHRGCNRELRLAVRWALAYKWKHWPGSQANSRWSLHPLCNLCCDDFIRRGEAIKRKARFGGTVAQEELFPAAGLKTAEMPSSRSRFLNHGKKGSQQMGKNLIPGPLTNHLQSMCPDSSGGQASKPLGLGFSYSPTEKSTCGGQSVSFHCFPSS